MPRKSGLPKYCIEDHDRYGKVRVYFRKPGLPKLLLHGMTGSAEFKLQYELALQGEREPKKTDKAKPNSWRWLCLKYMASEEFRSLRGTTPHTRRRILESTWKEEIRSETKGVIGRYGDLPISQMTPKQVKILRDRKAKFKAAANDRRKTMGYVFAWGMENHAELVLVNPVRDVMRFKRVVKNVPPWAESDFNVFMEKYPPGSKERRAMALHLYTGARGCDVRQFGPQHIKDGRFGFTQQKTGGEVDVPVLEELARELALAPKDQLAFILTEYGKTFSQKGYSQWFAEKCRKAGLVDRTAHGIRAGGATMAANNGASVYQLMAMFGWCSESMAIRYTKQANKKKLADSGMPLIRLERIKDETQGALSQ